ncbi:MAG: hypothetical protein WAM61_11130 [Desulfobacterales bacterium]
MSPDQDHREPIEALRLLDPELAAAVQRQLQRFDPASSATVTELLVEDTLWGLGREISFGEAIAAGYLRLMSRGAAAVLATYHRRVRAAGGRGATIGRLTAIHLVPVLLDGDRDLLRLFSDAVRVMEAKGTYSLPAPLAALSKLLDDNDRSAATVYLELLIAAFGPDLTYNQGLHLSSDLPRAALAFEAAKRVRQLEQLLRVVRADVRLVDAFLEGMQKGLQRLTPAALYRFVTMALDRTGREPEWSDRFLTLASRQGRDAFDELEVAVCLREMEAGLNRYLGARTGLKIAVRPLSAMDGRLPPLSSAAVTACTDGRFIYLPEEIVLFDCKKANADLYRCLARFESGHLEFGTFDFDLERWRDRCRAAPEAHAACESLGLPPTVDQPSGAAADLERLFALFPMPSLAADLFTVFEHGRIRRMLAQAYPGLVRAFLPFLQNAAGPRIGLMANLYAVIALGLPAGTKSGDNDRRGRLIRDLRDRFVERTEPPNGSVEASAELVILSYRTVADALDWLPDGMYRPLPTPFGRHLRPDLACAAGQALDQKALVLKKRLADKGIHIYRADLRKHLEIHQTTPCPAALAAMLESACQAGVTGNCGPPLPAEELCTLLTQALPELRGPLPADDQTAAGAVTWHREWDCRLSDYLNEHTRVRDCALAEKQSRFYRRVMEQHTGLVKRIRAAFELLKPQGLKLYRQWIDGDEFDYRALIDYILDKKAGLAPSERLYIKRLKVVRDVAVLLLVDVSRSTATPVTGSSARVLDVAKEAIVLFSEALEVVGDAYAIAGFSGSGRLGVEYFHVKDFTEPMTDVIRNRIDGLHPRQNTRMGAAVRHAAGQFAAVSSRVRLLILLGDGFPNDLDYKRRYAIEDTRRAISELRAQHIHVHAITIDIAAADGGRLDDLYGEIHHNLIADVADLPEKLWRIYGTLTRR